MKHPRFWHHVRWFGWAFAWFILTAIGTFSNIVQREWLWAAIYFVSMAANAWLALEWFDLIQEARHEQRALEYLAAYSAHEDPHHPEGSA